MDCGIALQTPSADSFGDWLTFIGLGAKLEQTGTPSTVGLDQDHNEENTPDAAILAASKKLTYGISLPSGLLCTSTAIAVSATTTTPTTNVNGDSSPNREAFQEQQQQQHSSRCNPQNCRQNSGMCIDCAHCRDCCICGGNNKSKYHSTPNLPQQAGYNDNNSTHIPPHRLSVRTREGLRAATTSTGQFIPQQELRKSPSLLSESSDDSACLDAALAAVNSTNNSTNKVTRSPSKSQSRSSKNTRSSRRYNMGDENGEFLYLTHRMLEDHSRRSATDTSTNSSIPSNCSVPYYISFDNTSNNTASRPRFNMGGIDDDDDDDYNYSKKPHRTAAGKKGHRRSDSGGSGSNHSRKSSTSFSLRLGRNKKNSNTTNNNQRSGSIKPTFSFGSSSQKTSDRSRGSASTAAKRDRSRGSASTAAKRANSVYGGSSLSSSSRSFLLNEEIEPKKSSWFRSRWNE